MLKSIKKLLAQEKEKYRIPRKVQDLIPIDCIWKDGIFRTGNKYSKTYRFTDINYQVASMDDKKQMFFAYSAILNGLDAGATTKITINNHRMNRWDFEESVLMPMRGNAQDIYRQEHNDMLLEKTVGSNSIMQEKYITVSVAKKNIQEARLYFSRIGPELTSRFAALGSRCSEVGIDDRLRTLHNFYRPGESDIFEFNMSQFMRRGHDFRDYICPNYMEKHGDYLKIGDRYARAFYLKDLASFVKDDMIDELTSLNRDMTLSIDIVPIPTDEAVREVENRLLGVETNITNWQRRQNKNNNFSAVIPYDMELQRKEAKEFLDDLTTRDQRMMLAVITMVITADTKEELDNETEALKTIAQNRMCQIATLNYQQMDGLKTVLPIGVRKINAFRTLTTESLAVFMPFKVQEIQDKGGMYYGQNAISNNLILCNKANLLNQSSILLGVPGAGKSFLTKQQIANLLLSTEDEILICDPENEYGALVKALCPDAAVISLEAGGKDRLNAMYMVDGYGESDPIVVKSQFIMSLIEQIDKKGVGPQQKSIIDRCVAAIYKEAKEVGYMPTLSTLRLKLLEQPEPQAKDIALALELFTTGSLDIFGHGSNVDLEKRVTVFDIRGLGTQLKPTGLLVITDTTRAAQKTAHATAKTMEKAVKAAQAAAKAAAEAAKVAAKAVVATVKAIIAGVKSLVAAIAAGGWVAVVVIIVIMLVALLVGSVFGIFFSSEDTGSPMTMQSVVHEINTDYQSSLDTIRSMTVHDKMEMSGTRAVWPEVLSVYAVKVNSDPDNPQEVASMDNAKKATLEEIFWEMNQISYRVETLEETVIVEEADENGNIIEVETTETITTLYIDVAHRDAASMAIEYGFTEEQKQMLNELLQEENASMWAAVLYGIHDPNEQIVAVARAQIGNVGGQPYWSWYGFNSRVAWCACFVSWCANECGYIEDGIIPKFAGCDNGAQWFKDRGRWADNTATPVPGMIIFFDWDSPDGESGPQDGLSDHVGIVEKVENGRVYTIEGNTGDSCRQRSYPLGWYEIYGYGVLCL